MDVENMPAGTLQDYSLRLDALERALFTRQQEVSICRCLDLRSDAVCSHMRWLIMLVYSYERT